jgi:hypothetical protein
MTRISTACSWVNIGSLCKAAILAQVGHFYSGGVGQYYSGANNRVFNDKWSGRKRDIFADHWTEMVEFLEEHPDQTALELLVEFQVRYPGRYSQRQLHTLQKRVRTWRQQAVQRLINEVSQTPSHVVVEACR